MNRNLWGRPLDEVSIEFLQSHCPPEGYWVACSFGKDSICTLDLVKRAGVAYEAHYNNTTCDPPELLQFAKQHYPDVAWDRPDRSMWKIIEQEGLPTRVMRACCKYLKERGGAGRVVVTGIRHAESVARQHRGPLELARRGPLKSFVHPIIEWRDEDVWCYIRERGLPYCHLYDEGFHRLGCVICPFERDVARSMRRWPKLWAAARRALQRRWDLHLADDSSVRARFDSCEDWWQWWLARDEPYPKPQRTCEGLFV